MPYYMGTQHTPPKSKSTESSRPYEENGVKKSGNSGLGGREPLTLNIGRYKRTFGQRADSATENPLSKCSGRPLGLCGRRLPELNLIPIQVIDPGKATVGFTHSFGVNLYSLLF